MFRKAPANLRVDLREPGLGDARPSCSLAAERDTGPRGGCWLRPPPLVCLVNGRQASISGGNDVQSVKAAPKRLATRLPRGASSGGTCPGHRAQAGSVGPALAAAEGTKGAAAPPRALRAHSPTGPTSARSRPRRPRCQTPRTLRGRLGRRGGGRGEKRGQTQPFAGSHRSGAGGSRGAAEHRARRPGQSRRGCGARRGRRGSARRRGRPRAEGSLSRPPASTARTHRGAGTELRGPPPSGRRGRAPAASPRGCGEPAASGGAGPAAGQQRGHR